MMQCRVRRTLQDRSESQKRPFVEVEFNNQFLAQILTCSPMNSDEVDEATLDAFIERHRSLLALEREAEVERTSLLLTNCAPKLLEQRGLALGGLGVVSAGIGLGGKTYVISS